MSDTRHWWKPRLANATTAASRIMRRLSPPLARAEAISAGAPLCARTTLDRRLDGPAVGRRPAVGERREVAAHARLGFEVEVCDDVALAVGSEREHDAPRVDDHRAPAGAQRRPRI